MQTTCMCLLMTIWLGQISLVQKRLAENTLNRKHLSHCMAACDMMVLQCDTTRTACGPALFDRHMVSNSLSHYMACLYSGIRVKFGRCFTTCSYAACMHVHDVKLAVEPGLFVTHI